MATIRTEILTTRLDVADVMSGLAGADPEAGALATFAGQVRGGDDLLALELEHFPGLTDRALERIAREAAARWSLSRAVILHRVGRMETGETIVFIAAAAPHRAAAFSGLQFMIDVLKTQAPFWKKEHRAGGARWIEPTPEDHALSDAWLRSAEAAPEGEHA